MIKEISFTGTQPLGMDKSNLCTLLAWIRATLTSVLLLSSVVPRPFENTAWYTLFAHVHNIP